MRTALLVLLLLFFLIPPIHAASGHWWQRLKARFGGREERLNIHRTQIDLDNFLIGQNNNLDLSLFLPFLKSLNIKAIYLNFHPHASVSEVNAFERAASKRFKFVKEEVSSNVPAGGLPHKLKKFIKAPEQLLIIDYDDLRLTEYSAKFPVARSSKSFQAQKLLPFRPRYSIDSLQSIQAALPHLME